MPPYLNRRVRPSTWLVTALILLLGPYATWGSVPAGFQDTLVATGLSAPSVLTFAPDGRLFVGEHASGKIRIVKNGTLLATPFLDLNGFMAPGTYFDNYSERGLLGIAFDPSFATNQLLYVYYTICKQPGNPPQPGTSTCVAAKNRIARFRANGDVVDTSSHTILLDDIASDSGNHNAGWIAFSPSDGKLYATAGDGGATPTSAQDLSTASGKVLRINADGSIPVDNPFVGQAGKRGEIWAYGLRNPWRCRFRADGRLLCADVGNATWEEIDVIFTANNYGWPTTEGPIDLATHPTFTPPIYSYPHNGASAAVVGGDFGSGTTFPGDYQQSYFFGDFALGWIKRAVMDASGTEVVAVENFATGLGTNSVTDIVAGPDGALYYTSYASNAVRKITAVTGNRSPSAQASATPVAGLPPLTVQFSSAGSSDPDGDPITYSWDFGDGTPASTAVNPSHVYQSAGPYTAQLTVSDGKAAPEPGTATIAITVGNPPLVTIGQPLDGATFQAGDTINLVGTASDPDQGALPSSALHWQVIFHHADHIHPYIDDLVGSPRSFVTAATGEAAADIAYEIALRATDATGLTSTTSVVIVPQTADFTLETTPPGLEVTLDGQTEMTPVTTTGVVGFQRTLGALSPQTVGAMQYRFAGWSDGGAQTHTITTASSARTYVASFAPVPTPTATPIATPTATPTPAPTVTPTPTATPTPMPTPTRTPTPLPSSTPSASPTPTTTPAANDLTALGSIIALVTAPTGTGNKNLEVIRDGDFPPVGTTDSTRQYDTYHGAPASEDWIGYAFATPRTFQRIVFQEGKHFGDGGWFDTLTVQVRQSGVWITVSGLVSNPPYPGATVGPTFETYTLDFAPMTGDAIRIDGAPGGSADFISVGELRVFGITPTPTPTATPTVSPTSAIATPVSCRVNFDTATHTQPVGAGTHFTFPVTVGSEPNRALYVGVQLEDATQADCTIGSVTSDLSGAFTLVDTAIIGSNGTFICTSLWYRLAPASGTHTIAIALPNTVTERNAGAIVLSHVAQQGPEASAQATLLGTPVSASITTLTDFAWLVDAVGAGNLAAMAPRSGQIARYDTSTSALPPTSSTGAGSTKEVAAHGAQTTSWGQAGANRLAMVVAAVAPESCAASPTTTRTPTPSPTPTATPTASATVTRTVTPTSTVTPTASSTLTPTTAPTSTLTVTPIASSTPTATAVPTVTPTTSRTATPTPLPVPTSTSTPNNDLTALGSIIALVTTPTGSGNRNLEVIRDGDFPPVGTTDSARQYDTYHGVPASEDWIGYAFATPRIFQRVVFQEGKHFSDGGWFDTLTVQVRQNGVWITVSGLTSTPAYPGAAVGPTFETYTLDFAPMTGDAIRIDGAPGGSADFISVGELRVFGTTPTPTPTPTATPTVSPTSAIATPVPCRVNFDTATHTQPVGAGTDFSFPVTVGSEPNRALYVGVQLEDPTQSDCAIDSVTSDLSGAFTLVDEAIATSNGTFICTSLWYRLAPASGTHTITIALPNTVTERNAGAIVLSHVAQQGPEASARATLLGTPVSASITTLTDFAWLVDAVGAGNLAAMAPGSGQIARYDTSTSALPPTSSTGAGSTKEVASHGAQTTSWGQAGANRLAMVVAAVAPESCAASPTTTRTPTPSPTPTATPTASATVTPTAAPTSTLIVTPIASSTPTATATATPTPLLVPSATSTPGNDLTALGTIIALVTTPTGSGNKNLEVIRNGDFPPVGTTDSARQYDTYHGVPASEDWIGYAFTTPRIFQRIVFQEGKHFGDGGWFDTLTVQVRQSGVWITVSGLTSTPAYPGASVGPTFETYTLDFAPTTGDAIRIDGVPGGSADFISVGELRVFGTTPTPVPTVTPIVTPTPT